MTTTADWRLRGVVTHFMDQHLENVNRQSTVKLQKERVFLTFKDPISDWKMHSDVSKSQMTATVKNSDKTILSNY